MRFKAIIFDLDGTLLNTLDDIADSANAVLRARGYPEYPVEKYKIFVGDGVRVLMQRALPDGSRSPGLVDDCLREFRAEYSRRWSVKTRPYDGVRRMLDAVRERPVKAAILSNKPDDFTRMCVEKLLPDCPFDAVVGNRPGIPYKPDPAAALDLAVRLGVAPRDTLFVGDSGIDVLTAVNAGMYPCGVLWGFRTREELTSSGARKLFERPREIPGFLDNDDA
jgi:phosphoglycolate phosphatase